MPQRKRAIPRHRQPARQESQTLLRDVETTGRRIPQTATVHSIKSDQTVDEKTISPKCAEINTLNS